jgi:hypothetical protein
MNGSIKKSSYCFEYEEELHNKILDINMIEIEKRQLESNRLKLHELKDMIIRQKINPIKRERRQEVVEKFGIVKRNVVKRSRKYVM